MLKSQKGQIVLITILVLAVGATVVLSLLGRTTVDLNITNQIEESSRAFSAAEAGIEEALKLGSSISSTTIPGVTDVTYKVDRISLGGTTGTYQVPTVVKKGEVASVWLINHDATGALIIAPTYTAPSIDLCWSGSTIPALVVAVIYKESTDNSYKVARGAWDPSARGGFTAGQTTSSCAVTGASYYRQTLTFNSLSPTLTPLTDTLIELRIRPLYADAQIAVVSAAQALAVQGNRFESSGMTLSGMTRKVLVFQQYRSALGIFDYAVYSQNNIVH